MHRGINAALSAMSSNDIWLDQLARQETTKINVSFELSDVGSALCQQPDDVVQPISRFCFVVMRNEVNAITFRSLQFDFLGINVISPFPFRQHLTPSTTLFSILGIDLCRNCFDAVDGKNVETHTHTHTLTSK